MDIIKKIAILVSIFFLVFSVAQAEAEDVHTFGRHSFTLSPLMGFLYGHAEEIVYSAPGSRQLLSELLWDLKPLLYVGLAADFGPRDPFQENGFIAAGSLKFGIPLRSGYHENRDWMNPQHNWLTHFSRHDVYSQNAILLDISAGYSWRLTDSLALSTFAEFSFMHFSWSGEGGFVQYPAPNLSPDFPPWSSDLPKRQLHGKVIRYSQNWFILSPGISLTWKINERFSLGGNFSYTPLIFCIARDDHILRGITFWDFVSFGHYINGGGTFVFSARDNLDIVFSLSYRHITGSRGRTYIQDSNGRTETVSDSAGAGFSAMNMGIAARIRLTGKN